MEKAQKKITEFEVELIDGSKRTLATLTKEELPKVKLDGKENDKGKCTSITLKRAIVKDTATEYVERRLFKYGSSKQAPNGSEVIMHDLPLPVTESAITAMPLEKKRDLIWKALRIDSDHEQVTGEGKPVEEKIIAKAEKLGLPASVIADMKKALVKHGFGK